MKNFKQKPATKHEREMIEAFNKYFITYRQQYIWQEKDGSYINSGKYNKKLTDTQILNHIRKIDTIGIFGGKCLSKFMIFDIDMKDKSEKEKQIAVKRIKNELQEIGIAPQFLHIIFSGNKGYHILLLFDDLMAISYIDSLYEYVIYKTRYYKKEIELRGKNNLGVKLPLSYHKVTGNICCFVDDDFNEIKNKNHIKNLYQYSSKIFIDVVREIESEMTAQKQLELKKIVLDENYKQPDCFKEYYDKEFTNEKAKFLEENGLQYTSSRHNSLLKLGIYYHTQGYCHDEIIDLLVEWMSRQNEKKYKTKWEDCIKDIHGIVKWIVERDVYIIDRNINIEVYDEEIETIMKLPRFTQQNMMYAMLVHSKRFASSTGVFFMSAKQIVDATCINSETTCFSIIKELELLGFIEIVRQGVANKPNKYRVLIRSDENIKQSRIKVESNVVDLMDNYISSLKLNYTKKELRDKINRKCYDRIINNGTTRYNLSKIS